MPKISQPKIEPNYIPNQEVPTRRLAADFWTSIFHKIPEGKALKVTGQDGKRCYEAIRKFKSREKAKWTEFEGRKIGDTVYIIHYAKNELNPNKQSEGNNHE